MLDKIEKLITEDKYSKRFGYGIVTFTVLYLIAQLIRGFWL